MIISTTKGQHVPLNEVAYIEDKNSFLILHMKGGGEIQILDEDLIEVNISTVVSRFAELHKKQLLKG